MRLHLEIVCLVEFSSLNQKRSQLETVSQISSQSEAVVAHLGHVATSDFPQSCTSACCSYPPIKSKYVLFVYFLIFSIQYGVYAPIANMNYLSVPRRELCFTWSPTHLV